MYVLHTTGLNKGLSYISIDIIQLIRSRIYDQIGIVIKPSFHRSTDIHFLFELCHANNLAFVRQLSSKCTKSML